MIDGPCATAAGPSPTSARGLNRQSRINIVGAGNRCRMGAASPGNGMRSVIYIVAALVLALIITVAAIPLIVSPETVQREAVGRIEALTGYQITVGGDSSLQVFPNLRFDIADVTIRVPGDDPEDRFVTASSLSGSIALLPLFGGRVEIESFALISPRFTLTSDRQGRRNWVVEGEAETESIVGTAAEEPQRLPIRDIKVGEIRIEDGHVSHLDRATGQTIEVSAVDATFNWPNLASPLNGSGTATWRDERLEVSFQVDAPLAIVGGEASPIRIEMRSSVANIGFRGNAAFADGPDLSGRLDLSSPSVREFLRWTGNDIGEGPGLERLEIAGTLEFADGTAAIDGMTMTLDGNRAEGGLQVATGGDRLGVEGTLAFETLDLNRYRSATPATGDGGGNASVRSGGSPETILDAPIDLTDFERVTADVRLSAGSVIFDPHRLGQTAATVQVRNGAFTLGVGETELHGGRGNGTVSLRPSGAATQARAAIVLNGVAVGPLIASLTDSQRIVGTGDLNFNVGGEGATLGNILSRLSGEARVTVTDGSVRGIDMTQAAEALRTGSLNGWPIGQDASTPFGSLGATFVIVQGLASTRDFRLAGPNLIVAAEGDLHIAAMAVNGRGTAALSGGADTAGPDFAIPFVIEGPLSRPRILPDPAWLLDQAAGSSQRLNDIRDRLEEIDPQETLDGLLERGLEGLRLPDLLGQPSPRQ